MIVIAKIFEKFVSTGNLAYPKGSCPFPRELFLLMKIVFLGTFFIDWGR